MQDKGKLILLAIVLVVLGLYFMVFGFSYDKYWRYGQYLGLGAIFLFFIDEFFRE